MKIYDQSGSWYRIGEEGWISSKYIKILKGGVNMNEAEMVIYTLLMDIEDFMDFEYEN